MTAESAIDPREFRAALGNFATGVTVITTVDPDGKPVGITANSFNWVSMDPPLILFSLGRNAHSLTAFQDHRHFAVNILKEGQEELSNRFAKPLSDKWTGVERTAWESGCPILMEALACFECRVQHTYDGGDHLIFVGQVLRLFSETEGRPLIFHQGRYSALETGD